MALSACITSARNTCRCIRVCLCIALNTAPIYSPSFTVTVSLGTEIFL